MIYVLALLHTIFCVALIGMILLHSGKGGGLSSSLGGGMGGAFSGTTVMEKNLTRLTIIVIGLFTVTSLLLIFLG
ncbi:MAG: preprotein translocase subunit SecG [Actinomycetota bacterium]|jgi:preprotein translocase subunit SecG|nr:preprotein translocase subunit SecG [Actinomycetota bacterium]MDQ3658338.1 preprotein translocase subunit SecG [Actinomycetota bacterium]